MVDNSSMRERLAESTRGVFGKLNALPGQNIENIFGTAQAKSIGSSNYYDVEAFFATVNVNRGERYQYVFNQFKSEIKPRKFIRYTAGVKVTEEQMQMDNESLRVMVENAAQKQERGLRTTLEADVVGYVTEQYLVSVLHKQPTAASSIIDPADCNSTPGTAANLATAKFIGSGQTERNLESVIGSLIRLIGAKVLDAVTGESILHNDGSDTYDLWCHPSFAHMLETSYDLLDTGEHDNLSYAQRLKQDWKVTIRPTMHIATCTMVEDATTVVGLSANTAENFKIVEVEKATWMAWKDIDTGEVIEYVKRYKAGKGAVAVPYISGTQAYKAIAFATVTPNGA